VSARTHLRPAGAALLALAVIFLSTGPRAARPAIAGEGTLAIHNGRLFDGTGAAPIEDAVVLIEGNRIVGAGPAGQVAVPADAATIDAGGGLIMPGVIDNHVHLLGAFVLPGDFLTPWLEAGVTSLVENGTARDGAVLPNGGVVEDGIAFLRALIEGFGERPPRVFIAGPILTAPGGYPVPTVDGRAIAALELTGPEDARAQVARLIDVRGAQLIKVAIETGFDTDYDDPGWPVLDAETLAAIAEAAHERGKTVRAHVTQAGELRAALEAGFDVAAHTPIELPDELLEEAAATGMIFTSTASLSGGNAPQVVAENLSRYAELGGRVTLGTDFPGFPPTGQAGSQMALAEMQLMVSGGLTPTQVLVAATKHGAEALGLGDELGTLEPGKLADVIVVDGDPLSDIAAMANVSVVVRDGEVVKGDVRQPPATSPLPQATATVVLPETGRGGDGGLPAWAVVLVAATAGAALLVGGALLVSRRRGA